MTDPAAKPTSDLELVITRLIDAPRAAVYRCWTDPELMKQWFAPAPWTTVKAELNLYVGGGNLIVMRSPEGQEFPNRGCYLEILPNAKLVFTDAYVGDWEPSAKPFMTVILTFEDEGGKTRYTARCRHWTAEDRDMHAKMGFEEGWGKCADQLAQLARTLTAIP